MAVVSNDGEVTLSIHDAETLAAALVNIRQMMNTNPQGLRILILEEVAKAIDALGFES